MAGATVDSIIFSNISATTVPFVLSRGGRFGVDVSGTFSSGSVILNKRSADGSTFVAVQNIEGSAAGFTASGYQVFDLPTGTYKFVLASVTAAYLSLQRIRGE